VSDITCTVIGVIRSPHTRPEHTPLLDIKPYIGRYDCREDATSGWQEDVDDDTAAKRGQRGFRDGSR